MSVFFAFLIISQAEREPCNAATDIVEKCFQKKLQLRFWCCLAAGFLALEFFEMCLCKGDACGKNDFLCLMFVLSDFVANNTTTCSF